jgi:hypothetical protein
MRKREAELLNGLQVQKVWGKECLSSNTWG